MSKYIMSCSFLSLHVNKGLFIPPFESISLTMFLALGLICRVFLGLKELFPSKLLFLSKSTVFKANLLSSSSVLQISLKNGFTICIPGRGAYLGHDFLQNFLAHLPDMLQLSGNIVGTISLFMPHL